MHLCIPTCFRIALFRTSVGTVKIYSRCNTKLCCGVKCTSNAWKITLISQPTDALQSDKFSTLTFPVIFTICLIRKPLSFVANYWRAAWLCNNCACISKSVVSKEQPVTKMSFKLEYQFYTAQNFLFLLMQTITLFHICVSCQNLVAIHICLIGLNWTYNCLNNDKLSGQHLYFSVSLFSLSRGITFLVN